MQYSKFVIKGFKGAGEVTLPLDGTPKTNIFPLVGLNESGKSTVLEAISYIGPEIFDLKQEDPSLSKITPEDCLSFIPVSKKYHFSGDILLAAQLEFSEEDVAMVKKYVREKMGYELVSMPDKLVISRKFIYENSQYKTQNTGWTFPLQARKPRGKKSLSLTVHNGWK